MTFEEKYRAAAKRASSKVCVGLDPDPLKLPDPVEKNTPGVIRFLKEIIDATQDLACAFKPNFAFFGALGSAGFSALEEVIDHIPDNVPVILDFKAGDIGNTAEKYAEMAYDVLEADAVTVNADDGALRGNRLRLLSQIRSTLHKVADFGEIEG